MAGTPAAAPSCPAAPLDFSEPAAVLLLEAEAAAVLLDSAALLDSAVLLESVALLDSSALEVDSLFSPATVAVELADV